VENSLKQRIIGAIVLIALAIIFLPAILKDKASSGTFVSKIPAKPEELDNYQVDTQKIDDLMAAQKMVKESAQASNNKQATVQTSDPDSKDKVVNDDILQQRAQHQSEANKRKTKQSEPNSEKLTSKDISVKTEQGESKISDAYRDAAWVVQVASFSNESNAKKMVTKLKASNYKAYRRKVSSANKTVFRIFVGPYIEKKDAEKAISAISKLSESSAVLRAFDPIKH
jgi:DedD protein